MSSLWTSTELREATQGRLDAELTVNGISIDTRTLEKGDLFIALVGENSDGHAHIATAFEKGAACVMVHRSLPSNDPRLLHVADTMIGLQALGHAARARFKQNGGRDRFGGQDHHQEHATLRLLRARSDPCCHCVLQ